MTGPTAGTTVHYTLNQQDAEAINKRRADTSAHFSEHRENSNGVQIHVGNTVSAGNVFPMVITRVWSATGPVQGQVFLDGNDVFWASSVPEGVGERTYTYITEGN